MFLVASIAGTCVSIIVEQIYFMTGPWHLQFASRSSWALNGLSWLYCFEILSLRAGAGAVWGATTAFVVVLLMGRFKNAEAREFQTLRPDGIGGLALLASAPLLLAALAPFVGYLVSQKGLVAGAVELRRALSFAPKQDSSHGEAVLTYTHDIDVPGARELASEVAPDGRSVIVRTKDHALVQVDLATGRMVRQVADRFGAREHPSAAWSPDGRHLALRSYGARMSIPGPTSASVRDLRQSRIRLYSLPDMLLVGEFPGRDGCLQPPSLASIMLFSNDSSTLWLACSSDQALTTDRPTSAMRFEVSSMTGDEIRIEGDFAIRGLARVGNSVWAWQSVSADEPFRIYDLTKQTAVVSIKKPKDLIGRMTEQTDRSQLDQQTARLEFCGFPPGSPVAADLAFSICRNLTFEIATGALIGSADHPDDRLVAKTGVLRHRLIGKGLRIDALWRNDNKLGDLLVHDAATGRERQRITSVAQRPLPMSADGQWLVTARLYDEGLRVYRVQP